MRINSINYVGANILNVRSQKVKQTKMTDGNVGFRGYNEVYRSILNRSFYKNYSNVEESFWKLYNAAKNEPGLTMRYQSLFANKDMWKTLSNFDALRSSSEEEVIKSRRYPSPLITTNDGVVEFHDPIYGEYGQGNISFWYGNSTVKVSRPKDFHAFYSNKNIKQYHEIIQDGGGIINQKFYNKDGSESFWKNLLFG